MRKLTTASLLFLLTAFLISSCAQPDIPKGYALIYGVADYTIFNKLNFTDDDAVALADLLKSKGWEVTLGLDEDADMASVTADVKALAGTMNEDDRFLFYFSGHGGPINLKGGEPNSASNELDEIIVLHGADTQVSSFMNGNTSADVLGVTLSDDSLYELLMKFPTKNKTVIIDACNSGGFIGDGFTFSNINSDYKLHESSTTFAPIESMKLYAGFIATENDLVQSEFTILTASGEAEDSYETYSYRHGVFTNFLLQTPANADYNNDGYITLIEAWKFISISIDYYWNSSSYISEDEQYMSNIAAFPVDPVLFKAD